MLSKVIGGVIEPRARETDRRCRFPRAAVDAIGEAGVLGSTVDRSLGGGGRSLADAVCDTEAVSALALRAVAIESAVRVTDLAMKISQAVSASTEASITAERRFRDARVTYAVPPTQDSVFEHIGAALVPGG